MNKEKELKEEKDKFQYPQIAFQDGFRVGMIEGELKKIAEVKEKIICWWANTMKISSTSTDLQELLSQIDDNSHPEETKGRFAIASKSKSNKRDGSSSGSDTKEKPLCRNCGKDKIHHTIKGYCDWQENGKKYEEAQAKEVNVGRGNLSRRQNE